MARAMPTRFGRNHVPHEGLNETGGASREYDVASQRQISASASGRAVDRRDHRQRQSLQTTNQRIEVFVDQLAKIRHGAWREVEIGQILARAKASTRTG
jgi:hypothetical protein